MSMQMADPQQGMVSFQQCLRAEMLELAPVGQHQDLYSHFDVPAPGIGRITYVRLTEDRSTVKAFLACIMNGSVEGFPCVAVGYAVPEDWRNQGLAKQILRDVIQDQILQAGRNGHSTVYIEAVVDVANRLSQQVAAAVLGVERESITDSESGRPAVRYTAHFNTVLERQM